MGAVGWALAAGALAWTGYGWGAQLLIANALRRGPAGRRRVALTFDDGPDPEATPRLLRLLEVRRLRATFFLVGARAERHPGLVRELVAAGHEVGNHTWRHRNAWFLTPAETAREIERGSDILAALTGEAPRYLRPPWGIVNLVTLRTARRLGQRLVLWSIQPEGLRPRPPDEQVRHVLARLHDGAILDLHDAEGVRGAPARLLTALPRLLDGLEARGYAPVSLGALLAP